MNNKYSIRKIRVIRFNSLFYNKLVFQVASGLFVINEVIDGGIRAADGARVAMLHGNRSELHRLGIKGEQTVRQQFADTREILQGLCGLDGAQHTSDGA